MFVFSTRACLLLALVPISVQFSQAPLLFGSVSWLSSSVSLTQSLLVSAAEVEGALGAPGCCWVTLWSWGAAGSGSARTSHAARPSATPANSRWGICRAHLWLESRGFMAGERTPDRVLCFCGACRSDNPLGQLGLPCSAAPGMRPSPEPQC